MLHQNLDKLLPKQTMLGDCQTPDELIARHGPMVRRIAWQVQSRMAANAEVEDLVQTGLIALFEAAQGYEDRGFAFATYASTRVRGAMIDQLRRDSRMSRTAMANRKRLLETRARLEQKLMREPDAAEMAQAMSLDLVSYHELRDQAAAIEERSIDDLYSDHDAAFADDLEQADSMIESAQLRELLVESIAALPEKEAMVLQLFFVEELNLQEIGTLLGVGAARVCQIKKSALGKLRFRIEEAL